MHPWPRLNKMEIYRVGGYVRDKLLGLVPHDCDYVVVGSTPAEMLNRGFRQVGSSFPVFLHPKTHEEYALARAEQKSGRGHRGFKIMANPQITLEEDLSRRDITINAIAEAEDGRLIDPYGGIADLRLGIIRHITSAFSDDPLRILRVARFAAQFGFQIAPQTMVLLTEMAKNAEGASISRERIVNELDKALHTKYAELFFEVLQQSQNLKVFFPDLAFALGASYAKFGAALKQTPSYLSRYCLLAISAGLPSINSAQQAYSELAGNKNLHKFMHACHLIANIIQNYALPSAELLPLLRQLEIIRKPQLFSQAASSYADYLRVQNNPAAAAKLTNLGEIINTLQGLDLKPITSLSLDNAQIGSKINDLYLTTIYRMKI